MPPTSNFSPELVLAGDIGATTSRLRLSDMGEGDPQTIREVEGPGFNVRSSGPEAKGAFAETLERLFASLSPAPEARLGRVHLGVAGAGPARHRDISQTLRELVTAAARHHGLACDERDVHVSDDLVTAYVGALSQPSEFDQPGILLLAGTGAAAVLLRGGEALTRRDGMGWLLGDVGSGVWLGRRALEVVAADLDSRGPATSLTTAVLARLGIPGDAADPRQEMIRALDGRAPATWGEIAPLVTREADGPRDDVARSLCAEAVETFLDHARALSTLTPEKPRLVVLAGSVLTHEGPIGSVLRYALEQTGFEVRLASSGLDGATRLAASRA